MVHLCCLSPETHTAPNWTLPGIAAEVPHGHTESFQGPNHLLMFYAAELQAMNQAPHQVRRCAEGALVFLQASLCVEDTVSIQVKAPSFNIGSGSKGDGHHIEQRSPTFLAARTASWKTTVPWMGVRGWFRDGSSTLQVRLTSCCAAWTSTSPQPRGWAPLAYSTYEVAGAILKALYVYM